MNYRPGYPIRYNRGSEWQPGNVLSVGLASLTLLIGGDRVSVPIDQHGYSPLIAPPF